MDSPIFFQLITDDLQQIGRAQNSLQHLEVKSFTNYKGEVFTGIVEQLFRVDSRRYQIVGRLAESMVVTPRPKNTYVTLDQADALYNQMTTAQRLPNITFRTDNGQLVNQLKNDMMKGDKTTMHVPGYGRAEVWIIRIDLKVELGQDRPQFDVTVKPTRLPEYTFLKGNEAILPLNKERTMKVFEGIVITIDEKGEPATIAKVIPPFLAKNLEEARTIIRVDYAQENKLNGKDASALQVRVREFCAG